MESSVAKSIERELGASIERSAALGGGDINEAYELNLSGGRRLFAKTNSRAPQGMFRAEARGLEWLAEARALRIPSVIAVSDEPAWLVLEFLDSAAREPRFDEALGRGLAELHRSGADAFGLDHDNFIGRLPQSNGRCRTFAEFYWERRLLPELERARAHGHASKRMERGLEFVHASLEELLGPEEPPARLHGDLWGGNLHVGPRGEPCLIDPAAYAGHREIDLAMMRLFGGFSERVFQAYAEAYPLKPGHEGRVPLFQLYPLLVHVNHFGQGYVSSVERALGALGVS